MSPHTTPAMANHTMSATSELGEDEADGVSAGNDGVSADGVSAGNDGVSAGNDGVSADGVS